MSDKTAADVADKALDKITGGIESVARAVEKVAHVWEVMVRQQIIEGVVDMAIWIILVVAYAVAFPKLWRRLSTIEDSEGMMASKIAMCIAGIFMLGFGLMEIRDAALQLGNPEYYAALRLIEVAK